MLTDKAVRAAAAREKAYKLADSRGLHLHISVSGHQSWRYKYLACDAGRPSRRIKADRIFPDATQPLAHIQIAQIFQHDRIACAVWELRVGAARAREIGPDIEAVIDIGNNQERRPIMVHWERAR